MKKRIVFEKVSTAFSEKLDNDKEKTGIFLNELFALVSEHLAIGETISIERFGQFAFSPESGIHFSPDETFAEIVNKPFSVFERTELNDGVTFDDIKEREKEPVETEKEIPVKKTQESQNEDLILPSPEEKISEEPGKKETQPIKKKHNYAIVASIGVSCVALISIILWWMQKNAAIPEKQVFPQKETVQAPVISTIKTDTVIPADTATFEEKKEEMARTIDTVRISSGDRLTLISLKYYGHKIFWVYIYEYNKNIIQNPNNIPIGTKLKIPAASVYNINAKDSRSIRTAVDLQSRILSNLEK